MSRDVIEKLATAPSMQSPLMQDCRQGELPVLPLAIERDEMAAVSLINFL